MKTKVHKGLSWLMALCMTVMLLPVSVLAEEVPAVADVSTAEEFQAAVENTAVTTINITANFDAAQKLVVRRPVTINGNSKTITFTGDEGGWQGNYVLQVYNTTNVTISNINLTGGDAALFVNGSTVALTGTIDVSGNAFGGIEAGKGSGVETQPVLTVSDNTALVNSTEAYGFPTIWEDGVEDNRVFGGGTFTKITKGSQPQYYLIESNAVDPETPVADIADLTIAVSSDGVISGDEAKADGTLAYYLVSDDKQSVIDGWNVETSADDIADDLGATAEEGKPALTIENNGKHLVVIETKDGKVVAAGQSAAINIEANVSTAAEFQAAMKNTAVTTINITDSFSTDQKLVVSRSVTISGNSKTITFTGDEDGWQGNYVLQVYNTTNVTISNINLTGGDAALFVNGSTVTLTGAIDVSGNAFGGIEAGKGSGVETQPVLTVTDATLVNSTEAYGLPTIWEDGVEDNRVSGGGTFTKITKGSQPQYYLNKDNAVEPGIATLTGVAVSGTAKVGETLTATVAPEEATATYQWQKADPADGKYTAITGATDSTYALSADDLGKFIKVVATGTGDYSGEVTSDATTAVAAADPETTALTGITVSGTAKVGETLTAAVAPEG
ncbi:pectate lyase-like adhesive domain-containing protein, partial [Oscillibacter sp. GMB15532]|uniref:pectate lyase-like adhesive domain-containing protein n=1 Tax=Oscillibacter sp. GMB15532 TaxID=3230022 RepID=UPI0034DFD058